MPSNMPRTFLIALFAATICAACGKDTTTSPTTTSEPSKTTEVFGGTLGIGDSQFYSFSVSQAGTADLTLLSLRPTGVLTTTLTTIVGLGLGTPSGTDCALRSATPAAPALIKQLSVALDPSTYCVKIADIGNLTTAVDYTVRVLHP
jgi:hypothetical protein